MNSECPICLEDKELCITGCNHKFCYDCLHKWLEINQDCPNCREKIENFKYEDEINRIVYINDIADLNLNMDELRTILRNTQQYRVLNRQILILLSLISFTSILFMSSTVYLSINCRYL